MDFQVLRFLYYLTSFSSFTPCLFPKYQGIYWQQHNEGFFDNNPRCISKKCFKDGRETGKALHLEKWSQICFCKAGEGTSKSWDPINTISLWPKVYLEYVIKIYFSQTIKFWSHHCWYSYLYFSMYRMVEGMSEAYHPNLQFFLPSVTFFT